MIIAIADLSARFVSRISVAQGETAYPYLIASGFPHRHPRMTLEASLRRISYLLITSGHLVYIFSEPRSRLLLYGDNLYEIHVFSLN